jgi:hypothetical protein
MRRILSCIGRAFLETAAQPHRILLDMSAKIVSWALSAAIFAAAGMWFAARAPLEEVEVAALESGIPSLVGAGLVSTLLSNTQTLVAFVLTSAALCWVAWIFIEAFVRAGLLGLTGQSFLADATSNFRVFLWSGLLGRAVLGLGCALTLVLVAGPLLTRDVGEWALIWPDLKWALLAAGVVLCLLAFGLLTLETLVRSDGVRSLGSDFGPVVGILLPMVFLEGTLVLTATLTGIAVAQWVRSPVVLMGTLLLLLAILSVNHSYMLLVRYCAIGIMRSEMGYGHSGNHANEH